MTATRGSIHRPFGALLGAVLILGGLLPIAAAPVFAATAVFINEIHYDNTSTDADEAVEIAGPAGTDLTGWSIVLYNGATGLAYDTDALSGTIADSGSGYGAAAIFYAVNGIQNGSPDGIALVSGLTVVQFLSYEGTFTAVDGAAAGMTSTDIGVSETGSEALGMSLQLVGSGTTYEEFTWQAPAAASFGSINAGQSFGAVVAEPVINEFSASTAGTDVEYVEVLEKPSTDLSAFTLLEIEGDGTGAGVIDEVVGAGTTDAGGFWVGNLPANALENGTITLLLVRGFSGALGNDLDTNNDGTLDVAPWTDVADAVAVNDGTAGDLTYGVPALGPNYDGLSSFAPGGASRIPNGVDTDTASDWVRNDFDLAGIQGFTGTPVFGEAINTPGVPNRLVSILLINEIDYDQPGTDTAEFLEIVNATASPIDLDDVTVELVNGSVGAIYTTIDLPAVSLAAGDYFVICANAANTPNCDLDADPNQDLIENGSPDAVGLRIAGVLVDAVSYEGDTVAPYTEGSGTGLEDSTAAGVGISRCPDGADSDQNNADFAQRAATPGTANNCPGTGPELGECGDPATFIHDVQGSDPLSAILGQAVVVEGVVVGDFQNNAATDDGELNGFNLEEEDAQADLDPTTSEGIFVFAPTAPDVSPGDLVRVVGTVTEFGTAGSTLTELTSVAGVLVCSSGNASPAAAVVSLPVTAVTDFERYEGMLATFPQALSISEFFNFDRFNEIVLTVGRQHQPTAVEEPGSPEAAAIAAENALGRITLDDGRTPQNVDPARHPNGNEFDLTNRFRGGDTVRDATGVIDHSFGIYRIHPTEGADYSTENPRPEEPADVGGSLKVASFNVLNYFTTLTSAGPVCGPLANQDCRGADTPTEFARQRTKIIAALAAIDADVVGLIEIENHPGDVPTADLVSGLNDALGAGTYAYIPTGAIGSDAIRVALIYKPATVTPAGAFEVLDSTDDARFLDDFNRPVLAQTFDENETAARFTVAVNHLKSKGSDCNAIGDPDIGDGQGNCNQTRLAAARALVDWLAGDPTGSGDRDVLVIGDLNSYDKEDPIDAVRAGADDVAGSGDDYTDLIFAHQGELAYSYLFDGQLGYLDHALGSPTISAQVTGTTVWHINADEPDILDYDMTFKQPAQDALFEPNAYRSSDHDPVIVGVDLAAFSFDGFYPPVVNPPDTNTAKAGSRLPLKFSLGGDFGLDVLSGTPQVYLCAEWPSGTSVDAASTSLSYDAAIDEYKFEWKTAKSWAGSCRTIELIFTDGTYRTLSVDLR